MSRAAEEKDRAVFADPRRPQLRREFAIDLHGRKALPLAKNRIATEPGEVWYADEEPFRTGADINQHRRIVVGQKLPGFLDGKVPSVGLC